MESKGTEPPPGYELVFRNVCVKVNQKVILSEVSGLARPGQMLAIMGPSGAGKSTLLNVLGGRQPIASGSVTLNNHLLNKQIRRKISYVLQEDTFLTYLTLWDTIWYTALLRLPQSMPTVEKEKRVNEIIDCLGIRKCLHTTIGDQMRRGLSGGEKKRANIACELLTNPMLMLLDEPTSGLDSSTAFQLMLTLKNFARRSGKTVVVTIHQPSSQVFNMFDSLLLLSDGKVAYFGELSNCALHFSSIGLECQPHYNLADFILDQVKATAEDVKLKIMEGALKLRSQDGYPQKLGGDELAKSEMFVVEQERLTTSKTADVMLGNINKAFDRSTDYLPSATDSIPSDCDGTNIDDLEGYKDEYEAKWPTGFWLQYKVLTIRAWKQSLPRILSKWNIIQTVIISIFVGMLWFQTGHDEDSLSDRLGILFFINVFMCFLALVDGVGSVPQERPVLNKERLAGYYRLSAYFCAKVSSDLPLLVILQVVFISITFWLSGINYSGLVYLQILGIIILVASTAQALGWFYGALLLNVTAAFLASTTTMLCVMLAGGFYVQQVPVWAAWIKYISFVQYAYLAMLTADLQSVKIRCSASVSRYCTLDLGNQTSNNIEHIPQQILLNEYTMSEDGWELYQYNLVLLGMMFLLRFGAYLVLRFIRKPVSR